MATYNSQIKKLLESNGFKIQIEGDRVIGHKYIPELGHAYECVFGTNLSQPYFHLTPREFFDQMGAAQGPMYIHKKNGNYVYRRDSATVAIQTLVDLINQAIERKVSNK